MNDERAPAERAKIGDTARALKMWRDLAGLNQRELALLAGIHYTTISDYETGKTVPQAETIARISAALSMTATDRREAEGYVRRTWPKLRATRWVGTDLPDLATPASTGEFAALRTEVMQTAQDGSRFVLRLLVLLFDLLFRIAEAVTGEAGPGKPDAQDR